MTISVLIAGHFRLYREGLAESLAREEEIEVVGSTGDQDETLMGIRELEPDIVLLDPRVAKHVGMIRKLSDPATGVKVIALGSPETEPEVIFYAEAGISGFVTYDDSLADLVASIRSVARGELLCTPRMAGTLLRRVRALAAERSLHPSEPRLTTREVEIVRLIDEGLSNKQIAARLQIAVPTVKHHVHHVFEKLAVARRTEAVARARLRGLLDADDLLTTSPMPPGTNPFVRANRRAQSP